MIQDWLILFQRVVQSQLFDNVTENFGSSIDDEQKLLEQRLLEQQRQSEEDSRWLAREEVTETSNLRQLFCNFFPSISYRNFHNYDDHFLFT